MTADQKTARQIQLGEACEKIFRSDFGSLRAVSISPSKAKRQEMNGELRNRSLRELEMLESILGARDYRELINAWCDLAAARSAKECAQGEIVDAVGDWDADLIEEPIRKRFAAEHEMAAAEAAIRLIEIRTGVGQ